MTGAERIAAERQRQMEVEGWTPEHDQEHDSGELARAAIAYAIEAIYDYEGIASYMHGGGGVWPWEPEWWKPTDDPIGNLVKAGALIAAEIDRLTAAGDS